VTQLDPIGLYIKALRAHAGFTQNEMAEKVGLTRAAISKAEMGRSVVMSVAPRIYDFFEVEASKRLTNEDNQYQEAENLGNPAPEGQ
jgi:transcriptional regulator with XRE-family HTH domain